MKLDVLGLIGACSYALDCVEAELVHVTNKCKACGIYERMHGNADGNHRQKTAGPGCVCTFA